MTEKFLTPTEAAARLSMGARTLANWRSQRKGPTYLKLGGKVLYRVSDLCDWSGEPLDIASQILPIDINYAFLVGTYRHRKN